MVSIPDELKRTLRIYRAKTLKAFKFDMSVSHEPLGSALGNPSGSVRLASEELASVFNCDSCWITSMGSTTSNHVCMAYISRMYPGKPVLVTANPHLSLVNAAADFNVPLRFIPIEYDSNFELPIPPSSHTVKNFVEAFPEAVALIVISPTYEGLKVNEESITRTIREINPEMPIFFDNAWGWGLDTPIANGADVVVRSSHKMDGAWQGGGVLLAQKERISIDIMAQCVSARFSTSQSYPILASVEMCYGIWHRFSNMLIRCFSAWSTIIKEALSEKRIDVLDESKIERYLSDSQIASIDQRKITFSSRPITGFALSKALHRMACYIPEKAGIHTLTLITSLRALELDPTEVVKNITSCLEALKTEMLSGTLCGSTIPKKVTPPLSLNKWENLRVLEIHEAVKSMSKKIPFEAACGHVAAELITPYPPGIPLIVPGQRITEKELAYLGVLTDLDGEIVAEDPLLKKIRVIDA